MMAFLRVESTGRMFFSTSSMGPGLWAIFSFRLSASRALFSLIWVACSEGSAPVSTRKKQSLHTEQINHTYVMSAYRTRLQISWGNICLYLGVCLYMNPKIYVTKDLVHLYADSLFILMLSWSAGKSRYNNSASAVPCRMCILTSSALSGRLRILCFRKFSV